MEDTPLEAIPSLAPKGRKINRRFIYLVLGIALLVLLFLAFRIMGPKEKGAITSNPAVVSPTPTLSPLPTSNPVTTNTPTPSPDAIDSGTGLDRSKLTITVENGSGTEGIAGKAQTLLKNLGYNVVSTGNADNFNYSNVTVEIKPSQSSYLPLLEKDLGFDYTIGSTSSELSDSFSTDALVIIGQ